MDLKSNPNSLPLTQSSEASDQENLESTKRKLLLRKHALMQEKRRRLARTNLIAFAKYTMPDFRINWHHQVLAKKLEELVRGNIQRLVVQLPPRVGKSELVSRRLPAYYFGHNPDHKIIAVSYADSLASTMNRDVQRIMDAESYRQLFPDSVLFGENVRSKAGGQWLRNSDQFEIVGHKGSYRSAGVGGGITGMGGDLLVIDDPIKNAEDAHSLVKRNSMWEWYTSTLRTRLERNGKILITATRWHEDDLIGRVLRLSEADPTADQWEVLTIPAIKETGEASLEDPRTIGESLWQWKFPEAEYGRIKGTVGSRVWSSLYQQRPTALEGGLIKRDWLRFYRQRPSHLDRIIASWDTAFTATSSFVVGQIWGCRGTERYLLYQARGRFDAPETIEQIRKLNALDSVRETVIENKANGAAIIAMLKKEIPGIVPFEVSTSKELRLSAVAIQFEAGQVFLPDPDLNPWVQDYIEELLTFPNAPFDDQVDATTQALLRLFKGQSVGGLLVVQR